MRPERPRLALALAAAALAAVASYTLQRLASAAAGELDPREVVATFTTPFAWRSLLAAVHGLTAAALTLFLVRPAAAAAALDRLPWVALPVAALAAAALLAVP